MRLPSGEGIHEVTQQNLINNLKDLFESFIKAIATAIEEKSNYTGGHIQRVAELTLMIADKINQMTEGPFTDTNFNKDEMEELRIAAWMHDTGKITTWLHDFRYVCVLIVSMSPYGWIDFQPHPHLGIGTLFHPPHKSFEQ